MPVPRFKSKVRKPKVTRVRTKPKIYKRRNSDGRWDNGGHNQVYDPAYHPAKARELVMGGATMREVASEFGVAYTTPYCWARNFPEFAAALIVGRESADNRIAHTLYERALGFFQEVEEIYVINGEVRRVKVQKYFPPDVTAMRFWLLNRASWGADRVMPTSLLQLDPRMLKALNLSVEELELFEGILQKMASVAALPSPLADDNVVEGEVATS